MKDKKAHQIVVRLSERNFQELLKLPGRNVTDKLTGLLESLAIDGNVQPEKETQNAG